MNEEKEQKDGQDEPKKEVQKVTLGLILGWSIGVLAGISGVALLFSQPLTGILTLLLAAVLLPPVNKMVEDKFSFSISGGLKFVLVIVLLGVIGATMDTETYSDPSSTNNGGATTQNNGNSAQEQQVAREWQEIASFSGSGSRSTRSFQLAGDETRIHWEFEDTSGMNAGMFSFYLVPVGTDVMETGGIPEVMVQNSDSDVQYVHGKEGEYYLEVNSANGPWAFVVEDKRPVEEQ